MECARRYDAERADELVFLDITASNEKREIVSELVETVAREVFIPLTVGGGIRTVEDFRGILRAGADKVSVNTAAFEDPGLIERAAGTFGSQCVVLAVDARRRNEGGPALGAVPIAMAVGAAGLTRNRDLPVYVVRMEQKQHGAKDLIAEPFSDDDNAVVSEALSVAIVEDTITTGGSVRKAIEAIEAAGAKVSLIAVLVERHEGGADTLRGEGYDVVSLFRADEAGQLIVNEDYLERLAAAS